MTVGGALKRLNIEDYGERIFNSNSHGELYHLADYIVIAESISDVGAQRFREWFVGTVAWAEKNWQRPESVFQHMPRMMLQETYDPPTVEGVK